MDIEQQVQSIIGAVYLAGAVCALVLLTITTAVQLVRSVWMWIRGIVR